MFLPENVKILIEKLNCAGYEAYAVGGAVRDSIIGKSADDYDIATSALPHETEAVFHDYRIIETGMQHGTVVVISGGSPVEITTFRFDGAYSDSRHPDSVTFTRSVTEDLARRDFTVNAIAYSHTTGFVDPFNGKADIQNQLIRCVGDPAKRFREDALRIMRALRFSSVLGYDIEKQTAEAIHAERSLLQNISVERIQKELLKLLKGKNALSVLLQFSDVIFEIIPELQAEYRHIQHGKKHGYDVWEHTCHTIDNIDPADDFLRLTMLFHDIGKVPVEKIKPNGDSDFSGHAACGAKITETVLKRLKFPTKTIQTVSFLVSIHDKPIPDTKTMTKQYLCDMGEENLIRFLKIRKADRSALAEGFRDISHEYQTAFAFAEEIKANHECYSLKDLHINGKELESALGITGAEIGQALSAALSAVICDKCNNNANDIIHYLKGEII